MGTGHVRPGDADLVLAVLDAARNDDPGPALPWVLLEGMQRLVPCDVEISYQRHDRRRHVLLVQAVAADGSRNLYEGGPQEDGDPFWQMWWFPTCGLPQLRAGPVHRGLTGELVLPLPAPPGESRSVVFLRSDGTPFDDRDHRVLELLRPHLQEAWLDAERRRAGVPRLSPREWEVLALAGAGLSTAEIAVALWVSVGTVRKHTEHIRARLGVHSIAAAAARALPHAPGGPLQPISPGR